MNIAALPVAHAIFSKRWYTESTLYINHYHSMEIQDKVVIVTGGSQGIGLAISKELASKGAKVVLAARGLEKLQEAEKEVPGSFAVQTDMRKPEDIKKLVDAAIEKFGRVDILINNAGQGMWTPVEKIVLDDYKQLMELNVYGPLLAMQEVIPHMRAQGGGTIINMISNSAKLVIPGIAGYASTKYAVNCLTLSARQELEKDHIVVSAVYPIIAMTDFGKHSIVPEPEWFRHPGEKDPKLPHVTAEEIAEAVTKIITSGEAETVVGVHA